MRGDPPRLSVAAIDEEPYIHEQRSSVLFNSGLAWVVILGGFALGAIAHSYAIVGAGVVLAAIDDVFRKLITRVDGDDISWQFTRGFPWGLIPLADVVDVQEARKGSGLWAFAGYAAVEITKRDRRVVTVGTDEPAALIAAIARFRGA